MNKKYIYSSFAFLTAALLLTSCQPKALTEDDVFAPYDESNVSELLQPEDTLYTLEEFKARFMTEKGNYLSDSSQYRTRATNGDGKYLFSIDTIRNYGPGIYIMGRICTDDYGGNFYKSPVIQQLIINGSDTVQQNLRLSVDIGSMGGLYHQGQLILIRCNGLAVGRYANQPQLCVPSYNNNILAQNATQKVGWAPGRIPAERFNLATTRLGVANKNKLYYERMTMKELNNKYLTKYADIVAARSLDGRLVKITGLHFTGEYEYNGTLTALHKYTPSDTATIGDPTKDEYSNVFAPTTNNVGYPQSRVIADETNTYKTLIGCSEYAKFASMYLPAKISEDFQTFDYADVTGSVIGILGYYADNAAYTTAEKIDQWNWSITPFDLSCFDMKHTYDDSPWMPIEFSKSNFPK